LSDPGIPASEEDALALPSPFADHLGFVVLERKRGFCRLAYAVRADHLNRSRVLHGGVLLALIDHAAGLADSWTEPGEEPRLSMTVDLDCRFAGPATPGARVIASARVVGGGRSLFFAQTEIHDEGGRLVAFGSSTHKRQRSEGQARA